MGFKRAWVWYLDTVLKGRAVGALVNGPGNAPSQSHFDIVLKRHFSNCLLLLSTARSSSFDIEDSWDVDIDLRPVECVFFSDSDWNVPWK